MDAMLQKRLARALFVLLLLTLVLSANRVDLVFFFLFHNFSILLPSPPLPKGVAFNGQVR